MWLTPRADGAHLIALKLDVVRRGRVASYDFMMTSSARAEHAQGVAR